MIVAYEDKISKRCKFDRKETLISQPINCGFFVSGVLTYLQYNYKLYVQIKLGVNELKPLNVRFSDNAVLRIADIEKKISIQGGNSKVARAALQIGLDVINQYSASYNGEFMPLSEFIKLKDKESLGSKK